MTKRHGDKARRRRHGQEEGARSEVDYSDQATHVVDLAEFETSQSVSPAMAATVDLEAAKGRVSIVPGYDPLQHVGQDLGVEEPAEEYEGPESFAKFDWELETGEQTSPIDANVLRAAAERLDGGREPLADQGVFGPPQTPVPQPPGMAAATLQSLAEATDESRAPEVTPLRFAPPSGPPAAPVPPSGQRPPHGPSSYEGPPHQGPPHPGASRQGPPHRPPHHPLPRQPPHHGTSGPQPSSGPPTSGHGQRARIAPRGASHPRHFGHGAKTSPEHHVPGETSDVFLADEFEHDAIKRSIWPILLGVGFVLFLLVGFAAFVFISFNR